MLIFTHKRCAVSLLPAAKKPVAAVEHKKKVKLARKAYNKADAQ
jgi:hypothetical protein